MALACCLVRAELSAADPPSPQAPNVAAQAREVVFDRGWDIAPLAQRRAAYAANQPWFGDLLAY